MVEEAGRRERLNPRTYTRWMRWNERHGTRRLNASVAPVIQDVDAPIGEAAGFLDFSEWHPAD